MLDPAYLVLVLMATVACPAVLQWTWDREHKKRKAFLAMLSR